jgi:hypothetical protein
LSVALISIRGHIAAEAGRIFYREKGHSKWMSICTLPALTYPPDFLTIFLP